MINDNIDIFSIATNGLISAEEKTFILDPLGYFVLKVKEDIVILPKYTAGGGYSSRLGGYKGATKKKKRIRLEVTFPEEINCEKFVEEFYLDNFNLTISNVELHGDNEIKITISNPQLGGEYVKILPISIKNINID